MTRSLLQQSQQSPPEARGQGLFPYSENASPQRMQTFVGVAAGGAETVVIAIPFQAPVKLIDESVAGVPAERRL